VEIASVTREGVASADYGRAEARVDSRLQLSVLKSRLYLSLINLPQLRMTPEQRNR
jgi:hypothetical protein